MSAYRARQLRDEPQSVRYPTREYQQRQPSLERGVADQTDLNNDEHGQSRLREELTKALRRDACAHLTEDSHISGWRRTDAINPVTGKPSGILVPASVPTSIGLVK